MNDLAPARRQWWFRTLLVVGVLAGVMGMHGLTAGHASMRMNPDKVMSATAVTSAAAVTSATAVTAHLVAAAGSRLTTHQTTEGHDPTGGHGAMQACVAILAAAVALLVLLLGRDRPSRPLFTSAGRASRGAALPRIPPRVLALSLHQLSICRT